jgi:glycosyltransferase involved in cell wall biosynthesis
MAPNSILYSIITASYNKADKIESTLKSAFDYNDFSLFEYIVIDGGSTDGTINILNKYAYQYPGKFKFISETDEGIYDAFNKGIDHANGEYLYFIGAGDLLVKDVLSLVEKELNHSLEMVYGNIIWGSNGWIVGGEVKNSDICQNFISHQAIFYHNEIFKTLGKYDLNYNVIADNYLNLMAFANRKVKKKYIPIEITIYDYGGYSSQTCDPKYACDILSAIRNNFGEDGINRYEFSGRMFYDAIRNYQDLKVLIIGNDKILFDIFDAVQAITKQYRNNIKIEGIVSNNMQLVGINYKGFEVTEVQPENFHNVDKIICAAFGNALSDLKHKLLKNGVLSSNIIAGGLAAFWSYSLSDFFEINDGCRIAIFGTGVLGQSVCKLLLYYNRTYDKNYTICCFLDNNKDKHGEKIQGLEIKLPSDIISETIDFFIIASMAKSEIRSQLTKIGVSEVKLINGGPSY